MTIDEYIDQVDEKWRSLVRQLFGLLETKLPHGFDLRYEWKMLGYGIMQGNEYFPLVYIGAQKGHVGVYHMAIYANQELLQWFTTQWANRCTNKLDMGKSCIRLKKEDPEQLKLLGELFSKLTPKQWIEIMTEAKTIRGIC